VIPLGKALQGHPEAGVLWEGMINCILKAPPLFFRNTCHERNLYRGDHDGRMVLLARQVNDYACGAPSVPLARRPLEHINTQVTTACTGLGTLTDKGYHTLYNGADIYQTRHYIL